MKTLGGSIKPIKYWKNFVQFGKYTYTNVTILRRILRLDEDYVLNKGRPTVQTR